MAVLTAGQLAEIRKASEAERHPIGYTKTQVNAALQAIEDWFEGERAVVGAAIEAAAPGAFTNAQKKALGKHYLMMKFNLGG